MDIKIIEDGIAKAELVRIAEKQFGDFVKAVVDVERSIMAIGGELHADMEALLIEDGSRQAHLWGINLYPAKAGPEWLEFNSMINVRPSQGNPSRGVEDPSIRARIVEVVSKLVTP
ncbi:MAG: hypothetical protein HYT42_01805 [Candidatus Sungbacteria bacterium]|nr:hypothetical protein [Candidatus Sungbacteria bacterium]